MRIQTLILNMLTAIVLVFSTSTAHAKNIQTAIFAGGCFWCIESDFDKVKGVQSTVSGYIGGNLQNPTYKQVTKGGTGHYEALQIKFDADQVSYVQLLSAFWHSVDVTDAGGQFCDRGDSYRTAVFATTPQQAASAEQSRSAAQAELGQKIVTPILMASTFYKAEEYHQNYHTKNPLKYKFYRTRCGRDKRVKQIWGNAAFPGS